MTRLLHTGDTHLGYQQYHVPERREDFEAAFRSVVEDAVAEDVDAVVHAGDLFHDRRPTLSDIMGAMDVLRELDAADIPFLAIVGNHEAKREAQWLDLYESLGLATRLGSEPEIVGETAVYGLDFVPQSQREALEYDFAAHDADHAVLAAHGLFEPFDLGEWDATEIIEGADVDFDALLLGDNHDPGTKQVADTWLTYCGSTERASAAEREDRGYNLVTLAEDVTISRRGIDTREFVFVDLELADHEGPETVRDRLDERDLADAVVIVTIEGEGEPLAPAGIEQYATEAGALVARVTDRREVEGDDEISVSFADPDDAVRERVRELGLSEAARDLDETIRASKVADSNVADEVQSRVETLVEDGDADVFAPSPVESSDADPSAADPAAATEDDADSTDDDATDAAADTDTTNDGHGGAADSSDEPGGDGHEATETSDEVTDDGDAAAGDGQASMEEYL